MTTRLMPELLMIYIISLIHRPSTAMTTLRVYIALHTFCTAIILLIGGDRRLEIRGKVCN